MNISTIGFALVLASQEVAACSCKLTHNKDEYFAKHEIVFVGRAIGAYYDEKTGILKTEFRISQNIKGPENVKFSVTSDVNECPLIVILLKEYIIFTDQDGKTSLCHGSSYYFPEVEIWVNALEDGDA